MKTLKRLFNLLTHQERKKTFFLLGMIIVMAFLDMAGVASIMPFMAVLTNPETIETNAILNKAYKISGNYGINTNQQFLFVLGMFVFILLVLSLTFKAITTYVQLRFILMLEKSLSQRLLKSFLYQPYSWFLNRHSADLGKSILSEVGEVCGSGLAPLFIIISQSIVTFALIALLIIVDPMLTIIASLILGLAYGGFYRFIHGYLNRIGQERFIANQQRFTSVTEAFGAIKEIKMGGIEQIYFQRFVGPAKSYAQKQASASILKQLPRFALEAITFGGLLLLSLYLLSQGGTFINAIPAIALYAFAGYRLMPALQAIYGSITQIRFVGPALNAIYDDLNIAHPEMIHKEKKHMPLKKAITLKNISYKYPNESRTTLQNISLSIPVNTTVGIVGVTGSGKTTTIDIILGLLDAQEGTLEIDNEIINKYNRRNWQNTIGYVPQQIYLADDTIEANIAFGIEPKNIDLDAVEKVAKIANLHDFIINELPLKYKTTVGERGIRLSGGQRQRIGIARALYHNPKVLILDEATNSLDNLTEQSVMKEVYKIGEKITVILIAHRLSTVKKCDCIFLLDKGKIIDQGTFDELIKNNESFRAAATKNS